MLVELKSIKSVSTDVFNPSIKNIIYCQLENFIQDGKGYRINGKYFYKSLIPKQNPEDLEEEQKYNEISVRQFSREFSNDELDNLYNYLNITYPENSNYTERKIIELYNGLKYIVNSETIFGLVGTDWE